MAKKSFNDIEIPVSNPAEMFVSSASKEAAAEVEEMDPGEKEASSVWKPEKKETKSYHMHVLIKPSTAKKLKAFAKRNKASANEVIGAAIEEFISKYE